MEAETERGRDRAGRIKCRDRGRDRQRQKTELNILFNWTVSIIMLFQRAVYKLSNNYH